MGIQAERVVRQFKAFDLGNVMLALLYLRVEKLLDTPAIQTDQMIVVLPFVELVNRFSAFEMASTQNAGLFKLGEHPINGGQPDVDAIKQGLAIDIFGGHVA